MLKIPSVRTIGTVTVYADDAVWYRFYLVPSTPRIRRDKTGRPVLLLSEYAFSSEDRAADPKLPKGGGYLNFDVELAVTDEERTAAQRELQTWVDEEYARRPHPVGGRAPKVEFAEPTWSSGVVRMLAPQSENLVEHRVAEQPASLVNGNAAVFNLDLTAPGASYMRKLMVGEPGGPAPDLTVVQVVYDLKMWALLPPIDIHVWADSTRVHETLKKIEETDRDDPCTPAEIETYRQNGVSSSKLVENGAVNITITKLDAKTPDAVVEQLRQYTLDMFDTMIENRFLVPAEGDDAELELDPVGTPAGVDPGWIALLYEHKDYGGRTFEVREDLSEFSQFAVSGVRVRAGHRVTLCEHPNYGGRTFTATSSTGWVGDQFNDLTRSVRVWRPPTVRRKVRSTINTSTMKLDVRLTQQQAVEWSAGGQATLATFFGGAAAQDIARHVVQVVADDFKTLGLTVRAFADFQADPITAVEVQVEYGTETQAFTFTAGETAPKVWNPNLVGDSRQYRSRWRIFHQDGTQSDFTNWATGSARDLNVSVLDPGKLSVQLSGVGLNWDLVRAATVSLSYADPEAGVPVTAQTYELRSDAPSAQWLARFNKPVRGSVRAEIEYTLQDEKKVKGPPVSFPATQTLFPVPSPQVDVLNVTLVPAGDWSEVTQAVVSLEYTDAQGRVFDRTYRLKSMEDLVEWKVLLQDATRRRFRYKALVAYKTGTTTDTDWIDKEGDQALAILVPGVPKQKVAVFANLVDFTKTPVVAVNLSRGTTRKTLSFTQSGNAIWETLAVAGQSPDYQYEIVWHTASGQQITSGVKTASGTELYVPKARLADAGKLEVTVRGFAVDYAATPFVDVELIWSDGAREERGSLTLSADAKNAKWVVDIGDRTVRRYRYQVTYNLADGTRVPGAGASTEDPVVSVTARATT